MAVNFALQLLMMIPHLPFPPSCTCAVSVAAVPQLPCHAGRLTVLLDLDGTLVSSFTPRRAPVLPPSMKTHLVGVGSSLNPAGVFVVERPGLGQFLQQLAAMSEVVVFTAGEELCVSALEVHSGKNMHYRILGGGGDWLYGQPVEQLLQHSCCVLHLVV